jgi:hypothetical protein
MNDIKKTYGSAWVRGARTDVIMENAAALAKRTAESSGRQCLRF